MSGAQPTAPKRRHHALDDSGLFIAELAQVLKTPYKPRDRKQRLPRPATQPSVGTCSAIYDLLFAPAAAGRMGK